VRLRICGGFPEDEVVALADRFWPISARLAPNVILFSPRFIENSGVLQI
jgi:hypothetical protein